MKYFKLQEFDSPDEKGSGKNMDERFLQMLDEARGIANVPFKVNSGFRTQKHNQWLIDNGYPASPDSSHLKGIAVDISCKFSNRRWLIINALLKVGINRIGIGKNFIHCDIDDSKPSNVVWVY